jgi:hypothetical protein
VKGPWPVPPCVLPKPPWKVRNKSDADAMVAWVNERLVVRQAERFNQLYEELKASGRVEIEANGPARVVHYTYEEALAEARKGNMEPLHEAAHRAGLSELVPFLQPKRARGQRGHIRNVRLARAKEDVHYIRHELWPQEYEGRSRRSLHDNPPSAESIAERFWNVKLARKSTI